MQAYVAGFLFNNEMTKVALVKKSKPEFLAGKLNAIGGKVNEGESYPIAMSREFSEETGVLIREWNWTPRVVLRKPAFWEVMFFMCVDSTSLKLVQTMEDEPIDVYDLATLNLDYHNPKTTNNLRWLLPIMLDNDINGIVHVEEKCKLA